MQRSTSSVSQRAMMAGFGVLSLIVGSAACGGGGGSGPAATPIFTGSPLLTPSPAPTPSPLPSPSPSPSPFPSPQTLGNVACTAADNVLPGIYFTITAIGGAVGNTFTAGSGQYVGMLFAAGPTPAPFPTARPIPTAAPGGLNYIWIAYFGTFTFPIYPTITTAPTSGCFELVTQQQLGQTVGEHVARVPLPHASASIPPFAYGTVVGIPAFASPQPGPTYVPGAYYLIPGNFTALSITDLTRTTGNGTFTTDFGGTGTITITGSTVSIGAGQ